MSCKQNDVHKCTDPKCGCEVKVTKAPATGIAGSHAHYCCCGKPMSKH